MSVRAFESVRGDPPSKVERQMEARRVRAVLHLSQPLTCGRLEYCHELGEGNGGLRALGAHGDDNAAHLCTTHTHSAPIEHTTRRDSEKERGRERE